jgi:hypothetical protein
VLVVRHRGTPVPLRIVSPIKRLSKDNLKGQRAILATRSGDRVRALAGTIEDWRPSSLAVRVPPGRARKAGYARRPLLRIFAAGKSVVAVTEKASRPAQCPLCPDSDQVLHRREMTRWAMSGTQIRVREGLPRGFVTPANGNQPKQLHDFRMSGGVHEPSRMPSLPQYARM